MKPYYAPKKLKSTRSGYWHNFKNVMDTLKQMRYNSHYEKKTVKPKNFFSRNTELNIIKRKLDFIGNDYPMKVYQKYDYQMKMPYLIAYSFEFDNYIFGYLRNYLQKRRIKPKLIRGSIVSKKTGQRGEYFKLYLLSKY